MRAVIALLLLGVSVPLHARISGDEHAAAEAFKAAVRGEREFSTEFMVKPPADEERAYLLNLGSCDASEMDEGWDDSVQIVWSCNMDGQRFQKAVNLWIEDGRIARVGVFDCINLERKRRCHG